MIGKCLSSGKKTLSRIGVVRLVIWILNDLPAWGGLMVLSDFRK